MALASVTGCIKFSWGEDTTPPSSDAATHAASAQSPDPWKPKPVRSLEGFSDASVAWPADVARGWERADHTMVVTLREGARAQEEPSSASIGRAPASSMESTLPCGAVVQETSGGFLLMNGAAPPRALGEGEAALVWSGQMTGPGRYAVLVTPDGRIHRADPSDLVPYSGAIEAHPACWIPGVLGRSRRWKELLPEAFEIHERRSEAHKECVEKVYAPVMKKVRGLRKDVVVRDGRLYVYRDDYLQGLLDNAFNKQRKVCRRSAQQAEAATTSLLESWERHAREELEKVARPSTPSPSAERTRTLEESNP